MDCSANWLSQVATWAQVVSAFAAVWALRFVGKQMQATRNSADYSALCSFFRDVTICERELNSAHSKEVAFYEYMNFLEVHAAAVNGRILQSITLTMVSDKVISALAMLKRTPSTHDLIVKATDSPETFREIHKFMCTNRLRIEDAVRAQEEADRGNEQRR